MRTNALILSLLLLVGPVLALSDRPDDDILIPKENFQVNLMDIDGVLTSGRFVTFEGNTSINAKRGATDIFIPFEKIRKIEMLNNDEVITKELPEISMTITLNDGSQYESTGMCHQEITGTADFGKFKIRLDHVRSIEFLPKEPAPEKQTPDASDDSSSLMESDTSEPAAPAESADTSVEPKAGQSRTALRTT